MGPRLGRVEYTPTARPGRRVGKASMGPRLGRVEYGVVWAGPDPRSGASMGPRLGRVEYVSVNNHHIQHADLLQWGHA